MSLSVINANQIPVTPDDEEHPKYLVEDNGAYRWPYEECVWVDWKDVEGQQEAIDSIEGEVVALFDGSDSYIYVSNDLRYMIYKYSQRKGICEMNKVYFYEIGSCRGDRFFNKVTLPLEKVISFITQILKTNEDDRYDVVEELSEKLFHKDDDNDYLRSNMAAYLVDTSFCGLSNDDINNRLIKLQNGERFGIEMEESSIGVGLSKDDAKLAYSEMDMPNNDDNWI